MDAKSGIFYFYFYFIRSSPVPYRQINSQDGCRGQYYFLMAHALLPLFPCGVLNTRVNPDTFRISVHGQMPFEYARCGKKTLPIKNSRIRVDGALWTHEKFRWLQQDSNRSVVRSALHQHRRGHGFESRWSYLNQFQVSSYKRQLLKLSR